MSITARQILLSVPRRFRPEKAQGINSAFHFIINGEENIELTVSISDGKCTITDSLSGTPACVITSDSQTYIALETGKMNPQTALMTGKIQVSNIAEMMSFSKCFRKFEESSLNEEPKERHSQISQNQKSAIRNKRTGPLEGVRIIDFTRLLPGPMATMMLADMGADVIKVEDPDAPDYIRHFEPMIGENSAYYYALNRNKRSLAINFLSDKGRAVLIDLIKNADVLIEQYRPGIMSKFGLAYEALSTINPRLIYISITGYGQASYKSHEAGHDINYISVAGALGITGDENGEPVIPGFQLADIAGGAYMTMNAVSAALYKREKTHTGEWIDLAMTDSVLPFVALPYAEYQAASGKRQRGNLMLSGGQANYNVYKCKDGKYIALGALEPKFWNAVCKRLGKPEWQEKITADVSAQKQLKKELLEIFVQKDKDEWLEFFKADDVCITPVNELSDIGTDKYLNERNLFINFEANGQEIKTMAQPIKFASVKESNNWIAPLLGEDTYTIMRELGKTDEAINELIRENIIKTR